MRGRIRTVGACAAAALVLTACEGEPPPTLPTTTPEPRAFTVATTSLAGQPDPAFAVTAADHEFAVNVFQRLMTVPHGQDVLKPDLATDCLFEAELIYECGLPPDATFADGSPVTAEDVKFSIERAIAREDADSARARWGSLSRIEVVDPVTVRFVLRRPDTEIGFALASPRASIVQQATYPAEGSLADPTQAMGSGPFVVASATEGQLTLARNPHYRGPHGPRLDEVVLVGYPDSASVEEAMQAGEVDAVWRALSNTAHIRLDDQLANNGSATDAGFSRETLPGGRVLRLIWARDSAHYADDELRAVVRDGLQDERTLDSIMPPRIPGYRSSFVQGGSPEVSVSWAQERVIRLGIDPRMPDALDLGAVLTTRLENTSALRVEVVEARESADLYLDDTPADTDTAMAWLQPYLDRPTARTAVALSLLRAQYGAVPDDTVRHSVVGTMQELAAQDATVVPVRQTDAWLYVGPDYAHDPAAFGPGQQLGMWGFHDIG